MRTRDIPDELRGKGFTSNQMKAAPLKAVFIWPVNQSIGYARTLARSLGREDLEIVGPDVLRDGAGRLIGRKLSDIILDHACKPSDLEWYNFENARASCVGRN